MGEDQRCREWKVVDGVPGSTWAPTQYSKGVPGLEDVLNDLEAAGWFVENIFACVVDEMQSFTVVATRPRDLEAE